MPPRIAYFLSHPVQYQSPLLRQLAAEGTAVTTVYGAGHTAGAYFNADYGETISWGLPLLEGYEHDFLTPPTTPQRFTGWKKSAGAWLDHHRPDAVWVHGWGTPFSMGCLLAALQRGLPLMLRGETHLHSRLGSSLRQQFHRAVLSRIFDRVDRVLAIGTANREFYLHYKVPAEKITMVPYVVDNQFFQAACQKSSPMREQFRAELGLDPRRPVLLYVGRLSSEKNVESLLSAARKLQSGTDIQHRPYLLIAGNGPMANVFKSWAVEAGGDFVRFLGFVAPPKLPSLYDLCDVFVLPSTFEPWGMVVNEAMNAGRAVVLSDAVGSTRDLLRDGWNGFQFPSGDSEALARVLNRLLTEPGLLREAGIRSLERINAWGLDLAVKGLKQASLGLPVKGASVQPSKTAARHGIELEYSAVHEIFQLAIAAEEMGEMRTLQCSLFDAPGKWGRLASKLAYLPSAFPMGSELLPPSKVKEIPLPVLARQIVQRTGLHRPFDMLPYNRWFDRQAASHLRHSDAAIAVASETCALHFFEAAKRKGMHCVLDCHGIPAPFLDQALQKAADTFGLPHPPPCDSPGMKWHKEQERELADALLFCSDLQKDLWIKLGARPEKSHAIPLWVDADFWKPGVERPIPQLPLRVVAVGAGTLAKGLPYLLEAVDRCGGSVELTLVGNPSTSMLPFIRACKHPPLQLPYMSRPSLRDFFASQHLLVMSSLGDSFGLVAMEAMACGLPVVVTENCGVLVPQPEWRVRTHDAGALGARLSWYVEDPTRIITDGDIAIQWARKFPASEYRRKVRAIYADLLSTPAPQSDPP